MRRLAVAVSGAIAALSAIADVGRVATVPEIDGDLSDAAWSKAEWKTGFRKFEREKRRDVKADTAFAVIADDESLYIGIKCFEPDMERLKTAVDNGIFSSRTDSVEIDFCPNGTPFERYQFVFGYRGDSYAMFYSESGNIKPDPYGPMFEHSVGSFADFWTIEIRIPLSALYMTRRDMWEGEWLFNVGRNRPGEGFSSWCDLGKPGEGFPTAKKYRRIKGFPMRREAEDVWVKSAIAHVDGKDGGGFRGRLELQVFATVPGEVSVETSFGSLKTSALKAGDTTIVVPATFPESGRIPCDIRLARAGGGAVLGRRYPVVVDYTPLALRFTSPGYRANFYPGQPACRVAGVVKAHVPGEVRVSLEGPGFPARAAVLPQGGGEFSFDTKDFEYGEAVLSVSAGGETLSRKVRRLAPRSTGHMTWIENGHLVLDGKPVFRRNMYAEYYMGGEAFREKYDADDLCQTREMVRIATLEPNRVINGLERREATKDVRPCAEYMAKLDGILENGRASTDGAYYYISDEPECRHISPVYLRHIYEYACERDPYHVILCGTRGGLRYIDCADWFETHPYVHQRVDANGRRSFGRGLLELGPFVDAFRPEEHPDKCIGCMPTCFAYPDGVAPTFREYVTHTWNFLIHGVKSFFPYAYHDLGDTPMTYEGVRFTNTTAERLSDFFLFGRRTPLACPRGSEGAVWELDGRRLFAIVNASFEPLQATVPGLDGKFFEFRGDCAFDCRAGGTAFSLKPLEAIVATSEKMDAGLPTYDEAERKVLALDALRTGRDNQLKGRQDDILVNGSVPKRNDNRKLVDGTLDVVAWSGRNAEDTSAEISFAGFVPVFRELRVYGANIADAKVGVRSGGEWTEPAAETETSKFSKVFRFDKALRAVKLRIDVPKPNDGVFEVYEIEMPSCDEAKSADVALEAAGGAAAVLNPSNALWRSDGPVATDNGTRVVKAAIPPEARWLVFQLSEAERIDKSKYSAWRLYAGQKKGAVRLAGDVTIPQKGLYTVPLSSEAASAGVLRLVAHNLKVTMPFIAAVAEPEQCLSFREEGGMWKFALHLSAPCEDVTCSLYGDDNHRPVPYSAGPSGAAVVLKPDASRRLWTAEIPVPPSIAARNGKPMRPWAKATVLGGSIAVPICSPLAKSGGDD